MKLLYNILLFILLFASGFAQNASTYFPPLEAKWYVKNIPLDSLNNPIDTLTFFQADSFAFATNYEGRPANVVLSRPAILEGSPFYDTSYIHLESSNAWEYSSGFEVTDTSSLLDSLGVVSFLRSLRGWYSVYRFGQPLGVAYDILKKDTTFTLDTLSLPVRIQVQGRRLADQNISTDVGNFDCKKFHVSILIGVIVLPGFPPVPVIGLDDTTWIAENNWIVKSVNPSAQLDFSLLGLPSAYLPGSYSEITNQPTTAVEEGLETIKGYSLRQNYPNPFNPSTKIRWQSSVGGLQTLKIFDVLGREVMTILNEERPAGINEITFNAGSLSSGIYFYQLKAGDFVQTRKMILLR